MIKIEADNLPTVTLGDSDQLVIGEWAIAIGNPLGLENTLTTGIISATGRSTSQIGVTDKRIDQKKRFQASPFKPKTLGLSHSEFLTLNS